MFPNRFPLLPLVLDDVPWGLRQMLAQEGIPTVSRDRRGVRGCFLLYDSRNGPCRRPLPGQVVIDVDRLRAGFEEDPFRQWSSYRTRRFQWRWKGLSPSEEICRVDKRGLRQRVMARLRRILERRGGVWLTVSPYPFPFRAAFNVRIDYDQYHPGDLRRLQAVLEGRQDAVSHFVNGAAYQPHGRFLSWLEQRDVGSHGYRHHTYQTHEENLRNIRRGIRVLEEARLHPVGFTAPHGRFNRSLLSALQQLEIGYSSEFAAACDDLPFFPPGSTVLQIPVHPVCLGSFLEAARAGGQADDKTVAAIAADYFRSVIQAKHSAGEPIFLYGHPTGRLGRYPEVLENIFDEVEGRSGLWPVTMSRWAAWWRARARTQISVFREEEYLVVEPDSGPAPWRLGLNLHRGRQVARLPLDDQRVRISPEAVPYEATDEPSKFQPVRVDGPHDLRARVRQWIDWELETPIEEIAPNNWRNLAKRTLRTLWR